MGRTLEGPGARPGGGRASGPRTPAEEAAAQLLSLSSQLLLTFPPLGPVQPEAPVADNSHM